MIRTIDPAEYAFLREMLFEAVYVHAGEVRPSRSFLDEPHVSRYFENFGGEGDLAYVLEIDKTLVGAVWVRQLGDSERGHGYVDAETPQLNIAIVAEFRNRGLGRKLLEALFAELRARGGQRISLSVDRRSPAVRLYLRSGFEVVAETATAYTMLKIL